MRISCITAHSLTPMSASKASPFLNDLTGMKAVVTGSSTGIGRAIALALARGGADVAIHCRHSLDAARQVAETIAAMGRESFVIEADVSNTNDRARLLNEVCYRWRPIDIWVNNAGADVLTGRNAQLSFSDKLQLLWSVDVVGSLLLSKAIGAQMQSWGNGTIINIGWDQAAIGMEGDSGELFAATKGAVMSFSRSLALSLASEVRVHCIAPGWIKTAWGESASDPWQQRVLEETPLKRWGTPEDVAALAAFLCSREAAYLTGQIWYCNGGAVRG